MPMNLDVENLPQNQKKLLLILPPVLIIALFVYLFIMPDWEEHGTLTKEFDNQTKHLEELKKDTAKLPGLKAENEQIRAKLLDLQQKLPEEREVSGLLKQVSDLTIESGLKIGLWRPKEKNLHSSNEVYEIPVDVDMRGSYHNAGQLFSSISGLQRIVNIRNVSFRPAGVKGTKDSAILGVSLTAVTYSMVPEKEIRERKEKERKEKEKKEKEEKEKKK